MQEPFADEFGDRAARREVRVELQERLGPKQAGREGIVANLPETVVANVDEALDVAAEPLDQLVPQVECVHALSLRRGCEA